MVQSLAFVSFVFGNQATLYSILKRRHLWRSRPGN